MTAQERLEPANLKPGIRNQGHYFRGFFPQACPLGTIVTPTYSPTKQVHFRPADPTNLALCALGLFVVAQDTEADSEGDVASIFTCEIDIGEPGDALYLIEDGGINTAPSDDAAAYPITIGTVVGPGLALLNPPGATLVGLYLMLEK